MREIKFYKTKNGTCPVEDFFETISDKQFEKVAWVLRLVKEFERVPKEYYKKLKSSDDIWEVRIQFGNNIFRVLGFFNGNKLVILTNGFAKKSQKVPKQEIELAEQRKRDYFKRGI
jgi:phage-related protein